MSEREGGRWETSDVFAELLLALSSSPPVWTFLFPRCGDSESADRKEKLPLRGASAPDGESSSSSSSFLLCSSPANLPASPGRVAASFPHHLSRRDAPRGGNGCFEDSRPGNVT